MVTIHQNATKIKKNNLRESHLPYPPKKNPTKNQKNSPSNKTVSGTKEKKRAEELDIEVDCRKEADVALSTSTCKSAKI